jgi:signal transduction histidine kinase
MEQDIILPLKAAGILMLLYSFYARKAWYGNVLGALDIAVEAAKYILLLYIALTAAIAGLLFLKRRLPVPLVQWAVFVNCLVDGIFLGALTVVTNGYDSPVYWLFLALIVRSAVSVPRATSQLLLNLTLSACYVFAGAIDVSIAQTLPDDDRMASGLSSLNNPTEPLFLRLLLLVLMTVCSYGVLVLLERQRRAVEEAREFAMREGQLHAAGRLAAEFTHQIKNPLAIINNAAYSLQRALKQGRPMAEQIQIIQEEVEHSDKIITQIMGYAQLSEGRVEKLDVIEELERAIRNVFPPAAGFPVQVHRQYSPPFPVLVMQRRHLFDTFVNVLQNAREVFDGKRGNIFIDALCHEDSSIEVGIRDDGPGIPPEKQARIFEAYYTTKEKGTGLGLATVKTNVELYGGTVKIESELGKGARFILIFPAKTVLKALE